MRVAKALALVLAAGLLAGCASINVRPDSGYRAVNKFRVAVLPPPGVLYSNTKAPLSFRAGHDFGSKVGRTTSSQIGLPPLPFPGLTMGIDLFAWGDASEQTAAAAGGITDVKHADYQREIFFMIYRRMTVEAYGD